MPYKSRYSAFLFVPVLGIFSVISEKTTEKTTEKTAPFRRRVQVAHGQSRSIAVIRSLNILYDKIKIISA